MHATYAMRRTQRNKRMVADMFLRFGRNCVCAGVFCLRSLRLLRTFLRSLRTPRGCRCVK